MSADKKTTSSVSAEILDLQKELNLKKVITIDDKGIGSVEDGLYVKSLPEELTEELLKAKTAHDTAFTAAVGHAFGGLAQDVMTKNKKLDRVTLRVPTVGRDHIDYVYDRKKSFVDPSAGGKGGTIEKFGQLRVSIDSYADRGNSGELSKVRKELAEQAKKAFG